MTPVKISFEQVGKEFVTRGEGGYPRGDHARCQAVLLLHDLKDAGVDSIVSHTALVTFHCEMAKRRGKASKIRG